MAKRREQPITEEASARMLTLRGTAFKTAISHRAGDTNSEGVKVRDECGSRLRLTSAADEIGHECPLLANQCPRRVSS